MLGRMPHVLGPEEGDLVPRCFMCCRLCWAVPSSEGQLTGPWGGVRLGQVGGRSRAREKGLGTVFSGEGAEGSPRSCPGSLGGGAVLGGVCLCSEQRARFPCLRTVQLVTGSSSSPLWLLGGSVKLEERGKSCDLQPALPNGLKVSGLCSGHGAGRAVRAAGVSPPARGAWLQQGLLQ